MAEKSKLRRSISRWANITHQEAADLRREFSAEGIVRIGEAPDREPVRLRGQLRTVTLRPRGGVPAIEAALFDGTDTLVLIWLGRRHITGIEPGRHLEVSGRIGRNESGRVLYNPRYELLP